MSHDAIDRLHFSNSALIWLKVMQSFNSIVYKINFEFNIEDVSQRGNYILYITKYKPNNLIFSDFSIFRY